MEPVTVGSLVATSLSMAAEAALKGAVGEVVKDGYKALKEKISRWASGEVAALEATPESIGRQTVVAEIIDAQSEDERKALRVLAEVLVARLKECAPAIGLDIGRLTALEAQLGKSPLQVASARGSTKRTSAPSRRATFLSAIHRENRDNSGESPSRCPEHWGSSHRTRSHRDVRSGS